MKTVLDKTVKQEKADSFAVGAILEGWRDMSLDAPKASPPANHQDLKVEITERDGTSFKGVLIISGKGANTKKTRTSSINITGTAKMEGSGAVIIKTAKEGKFEQTLTGEFSNGVFDFDVSGTNAFGDRVKGKGELKVK